MWVKKKKQQQQRNESTSNNWVKNRKIVMKRMENCHTQTHAHWNTHKAKIYCKYKILVVAPFNNFNVYRILVCFGCRLKLFPVFFSQHRVHWFFSFFTKYLFGSYGFFFSCEKDKIKYNKHYLSFLFPVYLCV